MTVNPFYFYALLWAFLLCAVGCVFFGSRLADRREQCDTLKRVNAFNDRERKREIAIFVSGILAKAQIGCELPRLDHAKFKTMQDLYDDPQLMGNAVPAQIATDSNNRPVVYWKHLTPSGLTSYELARLWLACVI